MINLLGFLWCLPVSIIVWVFMYIMHLLGQVQAFYIDNDFSFVWIIREDSWFSELCLMTENNFGCTIGNNLIVFCDTFDFDQSSHFHHEKIHLLQNYSFGIFYILFYGLNYAYIWLFMKDKNPYYDNYFESWARKETEKAVEIELDDFWS